MLVPPLPTDPSPAWSHPAWVFRARPWMLFCADAKSLLLQDPLIHPHGGLTPRLAFFSWLLIVLAVLVWAGALRGMLRWPPIPGPGWGVGCAGTPGSLPECEWGLEQQSKGDAQDPLFWGDLNVPLGHIFRVEGCSGRRLGCRFWGC